MTLITLSDADKERWNDFVAANASDGGLLQSWQWGEFWRSRDASIIRVGVTDSTDQLQAVALLVKMDLPFEYSYLMCPRGPVVGSNPRALAELLEGIRTIAREGKHFAVMFEPAWLIAGVEHASGKHAPVGLIDPTLAEVFSKFRIRKAEIEHQPKCSLLIDITKTEAELSAAMKPKTRYNISLAERRGVAVRVSTQIGDLESFWELLKQTATRDHFKPHPKEHYKKMFELLSADGTVRLLLAEYQGKVLAASVLASFGGVATFIHGGSSNVDRELMAPYLMQWQAMLLGKRLGCGRYDFGGVAGMTYAAPEWAGITRFKTGFSPTTPITEYIGNYVMVINPVVYGAYRFARQMRG